VPGGVRRIDDDAEAGRKTERAGVILKIPVRRVARLPDALQLRMPVGSARRLVPLRRAARARGQQQRHQRCRQCRG